MGMLHFSPIGRLTRLTPNRSNFGKRDSGCRRRRGVDISLWADEGRQFSDSPTSFLTSYQLLRKGGLFVNIDNEIMQEIDVTIRIPVVGYSDSLDSTPSAMCQLFLQ